MLTPKCRPRDFRVQARPNSPKKCLCRLKPNWGRNQAGIREEFGGLAMARKSFYINDLGWLETNPHALPLASVCRHGFTDSSGPWHSAQRSH